MVKEDKLLNLAKELQDKLLIQWRLMYCKDIYNLTKFNLHKVYNNVFHKIKNSKKPIIDKDPWLVLD